MQSIVEFVARARRRRNLRSFLESSSLGLAAAAIALAAALLSLAAAPRSFGDFFALAACGALSGLASGGTWWVERAKKTDLELARQIDQRLERDGALSTAFEACSRGEAGPAARWLEGRVMAGLEPGSLARALPGIGWIWLAPPAIGMALVAMVLEAPAHSLAPSSVATLGSPTAGGAATQASARAKAALLHAREQHLAASSDSGLRARLLAELGLASAELERLGDLGSPEAGLAQDLAAERSALGLASTSTPSGAAADPHAPRDTAKASGTAAGDESPGDAGKSLLTNGSPDRTMSGSNRSTAAANGARPAPGEPESGSVAEAGTIAGRWWPERYDPVVQGWRRALAARREQH